MINEAKYIWHNGKLIPWGDANLHLLTTAVQFGASLFEGIRAYKTPKGIAILHLDGHLKRLYNSCKIYRIEIPFDIATLRAACFETIAVNELGSCYIRPMVLRGYGAMGMDGVGSPIETYIPTWEWGAYLGVETMETGIDVCTSSWNRPASNTFPGIAKAAGNYNNAALIKMEAQALGFAEAIALSPDGMVSEGSGQNLFAVIDGVLFTPPINGSNLSGLTRRSALDIAEEMGLEVRIEAMPRELLYIADELFFTGTATEVMPIRSLDRIDVGNGGRGPVTEKIQMSFQDIVNGVVADRFGWLSYAE